MSEQFQIIGIKKPGGSDNSTTHITDVLVSFPSITQSLIPGLSGVLLPRLRTLGSLRPRANFAQEWRTVESVIADLDSGKLFYYTDQNGQRAEVIAVPQQVAAQHPLYRPLPTIFTSRRLVPRRRYIKTKSDSTKVDNLLSLPNYYGK